MASVDQKPANFRSTVSYGTPECPQIVDREGGMFESGMISKVSIITRGEALGHEMWVDQDFLSDVTAAINSAAIASPTGGVKARFTHPGLSSDGVGQKLGRVTNAQVSGEQVIADVHFQRASTISPDGNLAEYVMTLAEETPEDFGLSIVFEHDSELAELHVEANTSGNRYVSPDEDNLNNYVHAQLGRLRSADVVDSPAANPEGLFQRGQEAAREGEAFLEYALGLSDAKPNTSRFSVDADRAAIFFTRFLERHNLSLEEKEGNPVDNPDTPTVEKGPTRESFAAELDRYVERFGAESGSKWFSEGIPYTDALELHFESLELQISSLNDEVAELKETIASLDRGEDDGADFVPDDESPPVEKHLRNRIKIQGRLGEN